MRRRPVVPTQQLPCSHSLAANAHSTERLPGWPKPRRAKPTLEACGGIRGRQTRPIFFQLVGSLATEVTSSRMTVEQSLVRVRDVLVRIRSIPSRQPYPSSNSPYSKKSGFQGAVSLDFRRDDNLFTHDAPSPHPHPSLHQPRDSAQASHRHSTACRLFSYQSIALSGKTMALLLRLTSSDFPFLPRRVCPRQHDAAWPSEF